jgi:membrane protein DedA with SNARE-associated domain
MTALALHAGPYASLSGPIVDFCVNVIKDTGLAGVFFLMLAGSACIPIPSEAVMLFGGFTVSDGSHSMVAIVLAGLLGSLVGSWAAYAAGYYGRIDLLERNRLIHLSPARLAWVDRFFSRHGDAAVFWTRMMPVVRAFISLPAGMAKMPFWRFTWLTLLGSLPWVAGLAILGNAVGDNWDKWRNHLQYLDYAAVVAIVAGIAYLVIKRRRAGESGDEKPAPEPAGVRGN